MSRSLCDTRQWMRQGTSLFIRQVNLGDDALSAPSALPGWSRKHLLAHVCANADAVGNLIRWAATGEPTPMYRTPEERAAGIEAGIRLPAPDLGAWLHRSADALEGAMAGLSDEQWREPVVTAQGRTVSASEVPWMRAREVFVHAVDLAAGLAFTDLPAGFLVALCDDAVAKRGTGPGPALALEAEDTGGPWHLTGSGLPVTLSGQLAEITAYLTGRPHRVVTSSGEKAPVLPPWLLPARRSRYPSPAKKLE
jgi:uncharacterized protein (TIGR03083 family)